MTAFTRAQVDAIAVGTKIAFGIDGRFGEPTEVASIYAKQDDIHGNLFVCGYRVFGPTSTISFSIKEGREVDARLYRI